MNKSIYKNVYSITGKQYSENEIMQFHLKRYEHTLVHYVYHDKE